MDFLNPGLLGSQATFREQFATPIERWRDGAAAKRLRRATGPFILRRLKTDNDIISDLPEKIEMRVDCHLTTEQATLYRAVVDEMLERIEQEEGIARSGVVLQALMKLKQVCNHPAHLLKDRSRLNGRSDKLARLEEILEEAVAEGDKALCFTQFAEFGHQLRAHLQERLGREILFLHGGTPKATRDQMVQRFQSPEGPSLFVLSLKAGGTGLNLTAANHVIHFDRWWNPAVENQATDRAFRIGQRKNVQVRKLTCVGTLEERIDQLIAEKKDLAEQIVGSGEAWLAAMTSSVRAVRARTKPTRASTRPRRTTSSLSASTPTRSRCSRCRDSPWAPSAERSRDSPSTAPFQAPGAGGQCPERVCLDVRACRRRARTRAARLRGAVACSCAWPRRAG